MNIIFDSIKINNINASSGVFNGENTQTGWNTQQKMNNGLGMVIGDGNLLFQNVNVVYDNDLIDMPALNYSSGGDEAKKGKDGDD